ncbi:MAG: GNAT family N-acetyltransferase [Treponema sp.]|nr:GNAT family N-acetyltransferase [Treponema sp.]
MSENIKVEIIKTADPDHSGQLKVLYKEAGWWDGGDDKDPGFIDRIIQGSFCFAVASTNGRLIGMGRAISDGVCDAYIQDVSVLSEFRGRGIGALIVDELVKCLKSKHINWIGLISEPKAVSFYQRYGFSQMTGYVPFILEQ